MSTCLDIGWIYLSIYVKVVNMPTSTPDWKRLSIIIVVIIGVNIITVRTT
jgi:hypothetical protein